MSAELINELAARWPSTIVHDLSVLEPRLALRVRAREPVTALQLRLLPSGTQQGMPVMAEGISAGPMLGASAGVAAPLARQNTSQPNEAQQAGQILFACQNFAEPVITYPRRQT